MAWTSVVCGRGGRPRRGSAARVLAGNSSGVIFCADCGQRPGARTGTVILAPGMKLAGAAHGWLPKLANKLCNIGEVESPVFGRYSNPFLSATRPCVKEKRTGVTSSVHSRIQGST